MSRGRFGSTAIPFDDGARVTVGNIVATVYHATYLDRNTGLYDANEHLTQYEYLNNGKLSKMIYPDGTWERYTYGQPYHNPPNLGSGNLAKKEYGHDTTTTKTIHYVYDANNRLISEWGE